MLKKKGFTLIEILAVIVILGVLAVLVVPSLIGIINDSKERAYELQIKTIETAAKDYITEHGLTINELENVGGTYTMSLQELIGLGYLESGIINPLTSNEFNETTTTVLITKTTNSYTFVVNHS